MFCKVPLCVCCLVILYGQCVALEVGGRNAMPGGWVDINTGCWQPVLQSSGDQRGHEHADLGWSAKHSFTF